MDRSAKARNRNARKTPAPPRPWRARREGGLVLIHRLGSELGEHAEMPSRVRLATADDLRARLHSPIRGPPLRREARSTRAMLAPMRIKSSIRVSVEELLSTRRAHETRDGGEGLALSPDLERDRPREPPQGPLPAFGAGGNPHAHLSDAFGDHRFEDTKK